MKRCRIILRLCAAVLLPLWFAQAQMPTLDNLPPGSEPAAPGPEQPAPPPLDNLPADAASASGQPETGGEWDREPLRDPFWPVGWFPENWQGDEAENGEQGSLDDAGWKAAADLLDISGTSRMGDRTVALINGEIKKTGDTVFVIYQNREYHWEILSIADDGRIQLKKHIIR